METGGDTIVNVYSHQILEIIWMFYWGSTWQKRWYICQQYLLTKTFQSL